MKKTLIYTYSHANCCGHPNEIFARKVRVNKDTAFPVPALRCGRQTNSEISVIDIRIKR